MTPKQVAAEQMGEQTGACLVPSPGLGEALVLAAAAGQALILDFNPAQAEISRQADDLVFSLENGGSVAIAGFFAPADPAEGSNPALFTLPDGSQLSAPDFFASFNPELAVAKALPEGDPSEEASRLDGLLEGVSRLGALGTLYWGDAAGPPLQAEETSLSVNQVSQLGSSLATSAYLHAYDNNGTLKPGPSETQVNEISPGYYQPGPEQRQSLALPNPDDRAGWEVSGSLESVNNAAGAEKTGLSASGQGPDPFADSGFDLGAFIRDNTGLQDWEQGENSLGCLLRPVSVGGNEIDPKIEVAWSMQPGSPDGANPADLTLALLFKVGPDGQLILVGHQVLDYGLNADGTPRSSSGQVSWNVEPGQNYVASLVLVGAGPAGEGGTVLVIDGLEYVYQAEPVWVEPVYEEVFLFTAAAAGNLIADPQSADEPGKGVDQHSEGRDFSVVRFFLNDQWHPADGQAVCWEDENGASYEFTLNEQGGYNLEVKSADPAFAPDQDLNIIYEIASADGLTDQASLCLSADPSEAEPFTDPLIADSDLGHLDHLGDLGRGEPAGLELPNPPQPSESAESQTGYAAGYDDTAFIVTDFSLANHDRLNFANLLGDGEGLEQLLGAGQLTLSEEEDSLRLALTTDSGQGLQMDVSFQAGELESFSSAYVEKNGSSDGLEQALLQIMLFGA